MQDATSSQSHNKRRAFTQKFAAKSTVKVCLRCLFSVLGEEDGEPRENQHSNNLFTPQSEATGLADRHTDLPSPTDFSVLYLSGEIEKKTNCQIPCLAQTNLANKAECDAELCIANHYNNVLSFFECQQFFPPFDPPPKKKKLDGVLLLDEPIKK